MPERSEGGEALADRIHRMYAAISFTEGAEPDWADIDVVFLPHARLTRITPEGVDTFDLATFKAMVRDMLDRGVYTAFYEHEVARRVDQFGRLAHVLSVYETKSHARAHDYLSRGVNSIQWLLTDGSWQVVSLLWDEETATQPLALRQLFGGEVVHG